MIEDRLKNITGLLERENLEGLIVDDPIDLFYLTDLELSLGRLVITRDAPCLFVDGRYYEACRCSFPFPLFLTSGYEKESAFAKWWPLEGKRVGFDGEKTPYENYRRLGFLKSELISLHNPIKKIRAIKGKEEIEKLKKAALLASKGYKYILTLLKEGISEKEVAQKLELFWIQEGADRLSFSPHIAFGEGSCQPHYHPSERRLQEGDIVLIDIGVVYQHYHSDMTRVLVYGNVAPELETIYQVVYQAYTQAVELCRPGIPIRQLDQAARQCIAQAGYKEYFTHSLGHGVGLEIHELPPLRAENQGLLEEGMVITIEPGIYLPHIGGVRLEDTLVITGNGYETITQPPLTPLPQNLISVS